jgi:carbamoyl-phosphate synthase small subunit
MRPAILVLEDGEVFEGTAFGAGADALGEVVFNTGMTGYQEVLTDPSYQGQIVTMTYPHIGNYGTNDEDIESARPRVAGFVTRDLPPAWSSWRGQKSLDAYLQEWGIAGITEIDTRRLTRHIRTKGAMRGAISTRDLDAKSVLASVLALPQMAGADLVKDVSALEPYEWPAPKDVRFRVAAYDFGIKFNILRQLSERGCAVTVYPASTPASEVLASNPDGIFLSNGPGDPEAVRYGIKAVRELIGKVPIFGICLGHQLMALAMGLKTYKLRFGHRGVNHPVARLEGGSGGVAAPRAEQLHTLEAAIPPRSKVGAVEITTQNHGFAVEEAAFGYQRPARPGEPLPQGATAQGDFGKIELTHLNLNDYTVEGFRLATEPAFCVQYHPEAGPGPWDARYLFDEFIELVSGNGNGKGGANGKR